MKTITVRYRDISYDEAHKCYPHIKLTEELRRGWPVRNKNRTANLLVPLVIHSKCAKGLPKYLTDKISTLHGGKIALCPHLAEIGD